MTDDEKARRLMNLRVGLACGVFEGLIKGSVVDKTRSPRVDREEHSGVEWLRQFNPSAFIDKLVSHGTMRLSLEDLKTVRLMEENKGQLINELDSLRNAVVAYCDGKPQAPPRLVEEG